MTFAEFNERFFSIKEVGLEVFSIGKSVQGRDIYATHTGSYSGSQVIIQGGIHAREYLSSLLVARLARAYAAPRDYGGIYFVFATNPDGIALVLDGLDSIKCAPTRDYLTAINGGTDFSQYKANIDAVDLNTNFDAAWGTGTQNVFCPAAENFVGFYSVSERETRHLIDFTLKNAAAITISYHTKGDVIYWGFEGQTQSDLARDKDIGEKLSASTGYPLIFTTNSSGGYKDWCIDSLKIPSYTLEIGSSELPHPLGEENLQKIFEQNKDVPKIALDAALSLDR